jgi:hypothetical protein
MTGEVTGEAAGEAVALLKVLANALPSRSDAQKVLNLKSQAYFRERYLEPALAGGLVEMTLPDSPRKPKSALSFDWKRTDAAGKESLTGRASYLNLSRGHGVVQFIRLVLLIIDLYS